MFRLTLCSRFIRWRKLDALSSCCALPGFLTKDPTGALSVQALRYQNGTENV